MNRLLMAAPAALLLAGCVSTSPELLREQGAYRAGFDVDKSAATVAAEMRRAFSYCVALSVPMGGGVAVNEHAGNGGAVEFAIHSIATPMGPARTYMLAEVLPSSTARSRVNIIGFYRLENQQIVWPASLRAWARDGFRDCNQGKEPGETLTRG